MIAFCFLAKRFSPLRRTLFAGTATANYFCEVVKIMDVPLGAPAVTRRKIHFANPQGVANRHSNQPTNYKTIFYIKLIVKNYNFRAFSNDPLNYPQPLSASCLQIIRHKVVQ